MPGLAGRTFKVKDAKDPHPGCSDLVFRHSDHVPIPHGYNLPILHNWEGMGGRHHTGLNAHGAGVPSSATHSPGMAASRSRVGCQTHTIDPQAFKISV